jgi:glyoxylase-like metal-dependent hydrolase (beta-lactamase superfamily II)
MQSRRLLLLAPFLALTSLALWVSRGEAQPGTVKEIVPGVWFREGEIQQMGHCNNVIIEMKDYLIVIDANFPSGAELAMAAAKKVSSKPVRYVFDTHHHGDHAYGNPMWTKAGATTLAYVGVAEEMRRYEPAGWQGAAKTRKDVAALNLATAEPPKQTFSESPFVLEDETRRVEFHFFGWAHTRGDGFAYLPKEKVVATGDATATPETGPTCCGSSRARSATCSMFCQDTAVRAVWRSLTVNCVSSKSSTKRSKPHSTRTRI